MSEFKRDPKGYYSMLDVSASADAAAIKSAYRTKAKRLHPDINPSPIAAKQFQRLTEAYEILSDQEKRMAYDGSTPAAKAKASERNKQKTEQPPKAEKASKAEQNRKSQRSPPRNENTRSDNTTKHKAENQSYKKSKSSSKGAIKPEACQCGKVTAQPRYVIFDMISGQGTKLKRKAVAGIFCRSCADKAALRASLITWVAGWWAWPNGPKETVKALWNNIRGGRKPADRNTRLLVRQAKAFRDRGDAALARGIAEQALAYARTPDLRREVDILLLSLSAHSAKHLKTRWEKPGWALLAQLAPAIALVTWASMTITMSTPVTISDWIRQKSSVVLGLVSSPELATGKRAEVTTDALNLRTGPGQNYQVTLILTKGTAVTITELTTGSGWARIKTSSDETGFVPIRALAPLPDPL